MRNEPSTLRVAITAGAGGIGRTVAEKFLAEGASVSICDLDKSAIGAFVSAHPNTGAMTLDVAHEPDVTEFIKTTLEAFGGIDVLVNNAGVSGPVGRVDEIDLADWNRTLEVNLTSAFLCTRQFAPHMRAAGGGSIVNIASTSALFGTPLRTPYSASKWAMIGLTKTWAMELGPDNIRVNAICPGSVEGARLDEVIKQEARQRGVEPEVVREAYLNQTSLRTFVTAEEVADLVVFLSSPAARKISGQTIGLDGHTEGLSQIRI